LLHNVLSDHTSDSILLVNQCFDLGFITLRIVETRWQNISKEPLFGDLYRAVLGDIVRVKKANLHQLLCGANYWQEIERNKALRGTIDVNNDFLILEGVYSTRG
jgi:hypothetical protein